MVGTMKNSSAIILSLAGLLLGACGSGGGTGDAPSTVPPGSSTQGATQGTTQGEARPFAGTQDASGTPDSAPEDDPRPSLEVSVQRSIVEEDPDYAANILEALTTFVRPINAVSNVFGGRTLPVTYESCGEPNAFYSLGERRLILCEELVFLLRGFFFDSVFDGETDEEERGRLSNFAAFSSLAFVLYHEFAHALDDISGVAAGGNFESVADGIATVIAAETDQPFAVLYSALFFADNPEASLTDEHSSGTDRAGDLFCWVIGSDSRVAAALPDLAQALVDAGRDCTGEYFDQRDFVYGVAPSLRDLPPVSASGRRRLDEIDPLYGRIDDPLVERSRRAGRRGASGA